MPSSEHLQEVLTTTQPTESHMRIAVRTNHTPNTRVHTSQGTCRGGSSLKDK